MSKGKIEVKSENIFPVIKKFLYSDHEIFLRELVANAVDATQKLKAISGKGEYKGELGDLTIRIVADEENNTLTITDRGIGMTAREIHKYINEIAFSSAGDFLEKYKDQIENIIGHFGLGFYSAFMVAKRVEIESLSYLEGSEGVRWSCDGSPEYTMEECTRGERGTTVTLFLDDDSKVFATKSKVEELLSKYCKFMPVPIAFGKETEWKDGKSVDTDKDKIINNIEPLWYKTPTDIKDEEYLDFYHKLYPLHEDPLFWIHLNVDYPFTLTGILYFPRIKEGIKITRGRIQLFCNQMFVTDHVEHIVPDFLELLYGVIDSPDIPLNVSRSYLQADDNVKKISTYITRKVADRLYEISQERKKEFEEKWDSLKMFVEFGMLTDEKFCERALTFALFKTTDGKYIGYDDFRKVIEENQKDQEGKIVYLYATDATTQYQYIEAAKDRGYQVLLFDTNLDAHFINLLEHKLSGARFARVDSESIDALIPKESKEKPSLDPEEVEDLQNAFTALLPTENYYNLEVENLGENATPVLLTRNEIMRRYKDMSKYSGGVNFYGDMPDSYTLRLNWESPLVKQIVEEKNRTTSTSIAEIKLKIGSVKEHLGALESDAETGKEQKGEKSKDSKEVAKQKKEQEKANAKKRAELNNELDSLFEQRKNIMVEFARGSKLLHQVVDLSLLSCGMLKGKPLSDFISRSIDFLNKND